MEPWSAHLLYQKASELIDSETALLIQKYASHLRSRRLPVIFSLAHLGKITAIDYDYLHKSVSRKRESTSYKMFSVRKRSGGRRFIHAVNGKLFDLQKYINIEILQKVKPHSSSYAFHSSGGIKNCAAMHCGCKWLLQFDLKDFFYTIAEPIVYEIFTAMGYKPLLAFELSRLCTTTHLPNSKNSYLQFNKSMSNHIFNPSIKDHLTEKKKYPYPPQHLIGVLPQGAPTSPMLSNLAAVKLDKLLYDYAQSKGFVYTRYADDIALSTSVLPSCESIGKIQKEVISLIRNCGFQENRKKCM